MTTTHQPPVFAYPRATNGSAIAAFVLSILGFFFPPIAVLSFPFGIIALRQINEREEDGRGLAIASLAISAVSMLILVIVVVLVVIGIVAMQVPPGH
jgi:uncharacterized Tic20 family protein